jgi:hypothetical protein
MNNLSIETLEAGIFQTHKSVMNDAESLQDV